MKKASEYRQHAEECRLLASRMDSGEHRNQLLQMAATWEKLAEERSQLVRRRAKLEKSADADPPGGKTPQ